MSHGVMPAQGEVEHVELLGTLIKRKIESRLLYDEISKQVGDPMARNFLGFLVKEKKCQEDNLEDLCRKISGKSKCYLSLAESPDSSATMNFAAMDLPQLLSEAIQKEEEDYLAVLELSNDPLWFDQQEILFYLAEEMRVYLGTIRRFKEKITQQD